MNSKHVYPAPIPRTVNRWIKGAAKINKEIGIHEKEEQLILLFGTL